MSQQPQVPFPNQMEIGGRWVDDPEQMIGSIYQVVRESWAINEVPQELKARLALLELSAKKFGQDVQVLMQKANELYTKGIQP
jgi:hypothetical protein